MEQNLDESNMQDEDVVQDYMFMASCHGLESLNPVDPSCFYAMNMSCRANAHRRAIYGTVELTESVFNGLVSLMHNSKNGRHIALNLIKSTKYRLPQSNIKQFQRFLETIPNEELDPYS